MTQKRIAVVTGDVTIDWNLARSQTTTRVGALWDPDYTSRCYPQDGGAALLGEIVNKAAAGYEIRRVVLPDNSVRFPGSQGVSHSYTICFGYTGEKKDSPPIWRVREFLGVDKARKEKSDATLLDDPGGADLVIVDDANQGFRQSRIKNWPLSLRKPKDGAWLILKLAHPDPEKNDFLKRIEEKFENRIVVVLTVNDLRTKTMRISRELSWESSVNDLISEFGKGPDWLPKAHKSVISFYTEGAAILEDSGGARLIYDPHSIEGVWERAHPGKMFGYTQCLTAGIALQFLRKGNFNSIDRGVLAGLQASRYLHKIGFNPIGDHRSLPEHLKFPVSDVGKFLRKRSFETEERFSSRDLPSGQEDGWSLLQLIFSKPKEVFDLAARIIKSGHEKELENVPVGKFGDFIPLERGEIEGMRQIQALIGEYHKSHSETKPLSIAVFGPPGSGKSFAVNAVAQSLSKDGKIEKKEFNLSQFTGPQELLGAFHQIRDEALKGKIPLVFWDEFDSELGGKDFGWLRYFLAPMQDGTFQHGELTHPIGKAIFVFAGGTCHHLEEFEGRALVDIKSKGRDFLSRLRGFAIIPGLNHRKISYDPNVIVRRAVLLRSSLLRFAPDLLQKKGKEENMEIDSGVFRAFMGVREYKHGIRSLESIIRMSFLTGKSFFDRSSLPAEAQLQLHVDPAEFISFLEADDSKIVSNLYWKKIAADHEQEEPKPKDDALESALIKLIQQECKK